MKGLGRNFLRGDDGGIWGTCYYCMGIKYYGDAVRGIAVIQVSERQIKLKHHHAKVITL